MSDPTGAASTEASGSAPQDKELAAIQSLLQALSGLDSGARQRVVDYVFQRLGLSVPEAIVVDEGEPIPAASLPPRATSIARVNDIRSLKDQKKPRSANEMAALVAYYLSELAPESDRASTIGTAEVTKYFKQAGYPLPKVPKQTLQNAKTAGYFDTAAEGGYKLNPVGYNLVAHALPADGSSESATRGRTRSKAGKRAKKK